MKSTRIAAGLALALASTAALAVSGDRWYGTNAAAPPPLEPIVVTRVTPGLPEVYTYPPREVVVERRVMVPEEVIVERTYELLPGTYAIQKPYDHVTELNPQTGPHLDMGLFPRNGPNDFGS